MDNKSIAQLLGETADLLEIAAGDPFRVRSYRRAAEAVENSTEQLSSFVQEPERLLAIAGIGKGMAANIQEIETRGSLKLRDELLTKYRPTMLELLKLPGHGTENGSSALGSAAGQRCRTVAGRYRRRQARQPCPALGKS